jgi:uncharacterized membrane protein
VAIRLVIIAFSLAGLTISLYFMFAYYGRVKKARWIPEILCPGEGSSCVTVVQSPYARVLGVPNWLMGIGYYTWILGWVSDGITGWISGEHLNLLELQIGPVRFALFGAGHFALAFASLGTVALGFYLIYALRHILHIDCPLCYTAHAINAVLLVLLLLLAR